jgi:hypothetical protein
MTNQSKHDSDEELIRAKLVSETAKIAWSELQRFFAAGQALFVVAELDLIEVAFSFQQDDAGRVKGWLQQKMVYPVTNLQARQWINRDDIVWTVVVKPWVLVQDLK